LFFFHTIVIFITIMKSVAVALFGLVAVAAAQPTVYFIRHGEKPSSGDGLNSQGLQRAQCLRNVFGASSSYDIGHIMAQTPQSGKLGTGFWARHTFR
jgi:hypothetical protein